MYSVAPLVVRKALQDVRIGQYTIPAGTAMILHVFAMHNTSANYERHAEFLPVSYTHFRILCLTCSQVQLGNKPTQQRCLGTPVQRSHQCSL